ncbi:uncharacterized protein LOC113227862 [Hyposmocoma kahamanoa]|uniref:uncharacterized protein LOC113227862 n=1 Tax=Hyposmocoma kahamanoa TaxID=1477025 RepID=UPI000E6D992E|nr:uncharacterized protein LOC113227862 [Hyposmocoma kahamanoa]
MRTTYCYRLMAVSPSPNNCTVIQCNLHHSQTATVQLRKWLEANDTAVALIQEPWIGARGQINGLSHLRGKLLSTTISDKPRTCIYYSNKLHIQPLTQFCSRDLCAVKLLADAATGLPEVVLASVYMAETDVPPPQEMVQLINHCEQNGQHIVVATDSNAHHPLWGMELANERGKNLTEYLFTTNLQILNKGTTPTFVNKRSRTIIDLTLASDGAANLVHDWHVSEEASLSDHRWIRFNLETVIKVQQPKRNPRKTDRKIYTDKLHQSLEKPVAPGRLLDTAQIEIQVKELTSNILKSYNSACPLSDPAPRQGHQWWGPELERLRRRVRRHFNRAMNTCADEDWENYKTAKSKLKKRIRFRSTASWRGYCGNITSCAQANRVRKILANSNASELGSIRKTNNTFTTSPEETERTLLEAHFPGCRFVRDDRREEMNYNTSTRNWRYAE